MPVELVRATPEHLPDLARIFFEAFRTLQERHRVPVDIPNLDVATMIMGMLLSRPDIYGVAAVEHHKTLGCNFVQISDPVAGVGPLVVDPHAQSRGIGRQLMTHIVDWSLQHHGPMVRLVQEAINTVSISLYTSLGYTVQEPLVLMAVTPAPEADPSVRPLTTADLPACDALCRRIYKVSRNNELAAIIAHGPAIGAIPHGRFLNNQLTAYWLPGFFGHSVATSPDDLVTAIAQASRTLPPPMQVAFIPSRNGALFRTALRHGWKSLKMLNLMSLGPYDSPTGDWTPSISY